MGPPPDGLLVLVVEDEALIAFDLACRLEHHGFRVLGPAHSVPAAFRLLKGETPDVALLDANLGNETVTPVVALLRALRVPFVLASAYDDGQLAAKGLAGVPNVGKPTNTRRLLTALARAVQVGPSRDVGAATP